MVTDNNQQESYELVETSQFSHIDLERGEDQLQDHRQDQEQSRPSSESTRSSSSSSRNSQTSQLLQGINRYSDINNASEDFTSSPSYLNVKKNPVRRRLWVSAIIGSFITLWVVGLLGYSVGAKSPYHYKPPRPSNQSHTATSTREVKSATRTAIPLFEYDIFHEPVPLPTESIIGDVMLEPVIFLDSGSLNITKLEDEGIYLSTENRVFTLKKSSDRKFSQVLYDQNKFKYDNHEHEISNFNPGYTLKYAIVSTDQESEFRHSSKSLYWLYNIAEKTFEPISNDGKESKLSLAKWSPKFSFITFVQDNNLYVYDIKTKTSKQVSTDGKIDILNGKTDWVYEEEVLATDSAIWWSPDESNLVYMRTDDSKVIDHDLEFFIEDDQFPKIEKLKYPKPGGANPIVSLHNYNTKTGESKEVDRTGSTLGDDFVVYGCRWLDSENFIIRETNRESKILNYRHLSSKTEVTRVIHTVDALKEYNGWIEKFSDIVPISKNEKAGHSKIGFVDTIVVDGFNHLGYFELEEEEEAKVTPLTKGNWEVTSGALAFDQEEDRIFFTANRESSFENNLYSVDMKTRNLTSLTNTEQLGYYTVSFSPTSRHNIVTKDGPELPLMYGKDRLQKRGGITNVFGESITYHKVKVDEYKDGNPVTVNVIEVLPKNFKSNETHPLLVNIYGGPGSKKVSSKFQISFEDTLSQKTNAVILYIDPRGTGGQGWDYRAWANGHIGYWEPRDITNLTKQWIDSRPYIDEEKTAIWGWSYGGFSTLKTLEYDAGNVFKYGMAVAPVTDWTLYDSIYTERYMGQPKDNPDGYHESRINNVYAFKDVKRFLIMHGTGDDNVHVQNSLRLFDKFNLASITNFDMKLYPDSNHNINFHNANAIVYKKLETWLVNAFEGHFDNLLN